jgi:flagellar motor switch protein FliN/FliY
VGHRAPDQPTTDTPEMPDEPAENTPESVQPESVDPQGDTAEQPEPEAGTEPAGEPSDEDAAALATAMAAIQSVQGIADSADDEALADTAGNSSNFEPPVFDTSSLSEDKEGLDLLSDVNLNVRIELGRTKMFVEDVLKLNDGAVVELDKLAGDPVDVYVNDRHVAKGEVLVLNDNFCVRINEIVALTEN